MSAVLYDALGPRTRRRVLWGSVAVSVVLALAAYVAVRRFADSGQLDAERWEFFADPAVVRFFLQGLGNTVKVALLAMVLSCVLGGLLALGRLARTVPVRWPASSYVQGFRAVPLLLLIYFTDRLLGRYGLDVPAFWVLVIALVTYNGAVLGEIFRAGILSLDRGQSEAAYAVGLSYWQAMLLVVVPQAVRRMVPALVSQLITLLKDTSLGFVLPYQELLTKSQQAGEFSGSILQAAMIAAAMFVAVNLTLSRLARRLEVRQRRRYGAGQLQTGGGLEDIAVLEAEGEARLATAGRR